MTVEDVRNAARKFLKKRESKRLGNKVGRGEPAIRLGKIVESV